jgi:hypothetical protein
MILSGQMLMPNVTQKETFFDDEIAKPNLGDLDENFSEESSDSLLEDLISEEGKIKDDLSDGPALLTNKEIPNS